MADARRDQDQAGREADARGRLLGGGAADLPRSPWRHEAQPPSAVDLIQYALWRARTDDVDQEDLLAALALLPAARAEVDQVEAALLLTARAHGLAWPRISRAIGLGSPQAAQQRLDRVAGRVEERGRS
jgi:hypothetical protein